MASIKTNFEPSLVYHAFPGADCRQLTGFLYRSFVVVHDEPLNLGQPPASSDEIHRLDTATLTAIKVFAYRGHRLQPRPSLKKIYPEVFSEKRFMVFAFVADPLRTAGERYRWYLDSPLPEGRERDSLASYILKMPANPLAQLLQCNRWTMPWILRNYAFLGASDRAEQSISLLAAQISEFYSSFPSSQGSERARFLMSLYFNRPDQAASDAWLDEATASLDESTRDAFLKRNALDNRIYQTVCDRLDSHPLRNQTVYSFPAR